MLFSAIGGPCIGYSLVGVTYVMCALLCSQYMLAFLML